MTAAAGLMDVEERDVPLPVEARVGVLGWLGFLIINFAIWGLITVVSSIAWASGFGVCLLYTAGLIALTLWMEQRGIKYRQFVNLLWVLACWFIFILGIYISVQVIGGGLDRGPVGKVDELGSDTSHGQVYEMGHHTSHLTSLVPDSASEELRTWWSNKPVYTSICFATFNGSVFFSGHDSEERVHSLWYTSDGPVAKKVLPELHGPVKYFTEFRSSLYFAASSSSSDEEGLWRIKAGEPGIVEQVFGMDKMELQIRGLHVDADLLFIKATVKHDCPGACFDLSNYVDTLLQSDGSPEGTVDLMQDPCAHVERCPDVASPDDDLPSALPKAALWGVLLVATVPMVALASFILFQRKLPGPFVNVFGGVWGAVVTLYLIVMDSDDMLEGLSDFLAWFNIFYAFVSWVGLVAWSLLSGALDPWLEELKTWAAATVGVTFFVAIHCNLGFIALVSFGGAWHWLVYGILALLQLVFSMAVSRTVPMVVAAICVFILAWKIACDIVKFADIGSGDLATLAILTILALEGIGIIGAAASYAGNRDRVDSAVRKALLFGNSPKS